MSVAVSYLNSSMIFLYEGKKVRQVMSAEEAKHDLVMVRFSQWVYLVGQGGMGNIFYACSSRIYDSDST